VKGLLHRWGLIVGLALSACSVDSPWTVSTVGFGPIRLGQTFDEVDSALPDDIAPPSPPDGCVVIVPAGWPEGVSLMIAQGVVARIDVRSGSVATSEGARIGITESAVESLYPGQIEVLPHKYTAGNYLTVTPRADAAPGVRIVFETDGARVTQYRVGTLPSITPYLGRTVN
jgi:hypothetical protein